MTFMIMYSRWGMVLGDGEALVMRLVDGLYHVCIRDEFDVGPAWQNLLMIDEFREHGYVGVKSDLHIAVDVNTCSIGFLLAYVRWIQILSADVVMSTKAIWT